MLADLETCTSLHEGEGGGGGGGGEGGVPS